MGPRLQTFRERILAPAIRAQIGKGSDQYLPAFLTPDEIQRFGKELDEYRSDLFKQEYLQRVQPFPQVRELFQRIRDDGKPIVLATSGKKSEAKHYIKLLGVDDLVEAKTTADDVENSKPAPDIFTAAIQKLDGITASQALVVGDTRFDQEAAGRGGFRAIGVTCGGTDEWVLREAGAAGIYRDPADLLSSYDDLTAKLSGLAEPA